MYQIMNEIMIRVVDHTIILNNSIKKLISIFILLILASSRASRSFNILFKKNSKGVLREDR
jgi:hypothetical protein